MPSNTIRICGVAYRVVFVTDEELPDDAGQIQSRHCLIRIRRSAPNDRRAEVLLHEIVHGICYECHLPLDEQTVATLAAGLYGVLRDNPVMRFENMRTGEETP